MSSSAFLSPQQGAVEQFLLRSQGSTLVCMVQLKPDHSSQGVITWVVPEILKSFQWKTQKKEREKKKESQSYAFSAPPVIAGKPKPAAPGTQWGRKLPQAIFEITACLRSHSVWLGPNCHCNISKSELAQVFPREKGGSGFTNKAADDFSTGVCCRCLCVHTYVVGFILGAIPKF